MMALMLSAKGSDISHWRAVGDFSATFRQTLLDRLEYCGSDESERLLSTTMSALERLAAENDAFCQTYEGLIAAVVASLEPEPLRELTVAYYAALYSHVRRHRSAPAFYQASSAFLRALAGAVCRHAKNRLGSLSGQIPTFELVALGPAGRQEFSPFCPLQLALVHEHADHPDEEAISRFASFIHEGFEACGLKVDSAITPRNPQWRGSISEWRERQAQKLEQGGAEEFLDIFRLADQSALFCDEGFTHEFYGLCKNLLTDHRSAMASLVSRVRNISHGIGIMGGLRFEKNGPYRGLFALRDNALQPLSASVCVLALIRGLATRTTPQRIREILLKGELSVDMTERLLLAWHALHELRLVRESSVQSDWSSEANLYLDIDELNVEEQNLLRETLEAVGMIQRHVAIIYSGMEV
jgi:signal-transduction protein with cAMP-binding, CBS, and nucleotidyltransferase domain